MKVLPVILSGGSGTRLWPLSRNSLPKQFLTSFSDYSLFQQTILRLKHLNIDEILEPLIICNYEHRYLVKNQLEEIESQFSDIIAEPFPKNTAPALAIASLYAINKFSEDVKLIVLPSDHKIKDDIAFSKIIKKAVTECHDRSIITFGLEPDFPHTGYGYIQKGDIKDQEESCPLYEVNNFIEKPSKNLATQLVEEGNYLWNSGIFVLSSQTFIDSASAISKNMIDICKESLNQAKKDYSFLLLEEEKFAKVLSDSIDYLLLENLDLKKYCLKVISLDVGWTDLGSWSSVWSELDKDQDGNTKLGKVISLDSKNNLIFSQEHLVATLGVEDLVVISSEDALLVAKKDDSEQVKDLIEIFKDKNFPETDSHVVTFRPWGSFKTLEEGINFKVKKLTINSKQKISLQKHSFRSEHWVVVKGKAQITKDKEVFILNVNESTYIPVGSIHSIENPTDDKLELIEVQSGDYLGEDDIHRFEDIYGREDDKN